MRRQLQRGRRSTDLRRRRRRRLGLGETFGGGGRELVGAFVMTVTGLTGEEEAFG